MQVANSAKVTSAAPEGLTGSWLIDPQDFTVAASGGDISGATLSKRLGNELGHAAEQSGRQGGERERQHR